MTPAALERARRYRERHREKIRERKRAAWKNRDRRQTKGEWLRRGFGISVEEYESLAEMQGGVCAICRRQETSLAPRSKYDAERKVRALAVDHDHETGKVRGLLCSNCNNGLGRFKDDTGRLKAALAYLVTHEASE